MEDIIEDLQERALTVAVPLELPNEDQLVDIEEQLLIPMPHELREFLLKVSDIVYGSIEPVTVTDPNCHSYLPEVAANAWAAGLPRELIPICSHHSEYYAISQEGEVLHWVAGEIAEHKWPSIWLWVKEIWLGTY